MSQTKAKSSAYHEQSIVYKAYSTLSLFNCFRTILQSLEVLMSISLATWLNQSLSSKWQGCLQVVSKSSFSVKVGNETKSSSLKAWTVGTKQRTLFHVVVYYWSFYFYRRVLILILQFHQNNLAYANPQTQQAFQDFNSLLVCFFFCSASRPCGLPFGG